MCDAFCPRPPPPLPPPLLGTAGATRYAGLVGSARAVGTDSRISVGVVQPQSAALPQPPLQPASPAPPLPSAQPLPHHTQPQPQQPLLHSMPPSPRPPPPPMLWRSLLPAAASHPAQLSLSMQMMPRQHQLHEYAPPPQQQQAYVPPQRQQQVYALPRQQQAYLPPPQPQAYASLPQHQAYASPPQHQVYSPQPQQLQPSQPYPISLGKVAQAPTMYAASQQQPYTPAAAYGSPLAFAEGYWAVPVRSRAEHGTLPRASHGVLPTPM